MKTKEVVIIQTGIANTASVIAGLERAGAKVRLSENPEVVCAADYLVLPGVGAFEAGMETLNNAKLLQPLKDHCMAQKPLLAVCLGLQLLFEESEESPQIHGLGIFKGSIRRFPNTVRVPQLGWNEVVPEKECCYLENGYAYFANSYRLTNCPENCKAAWTDYAGRFVSSFEYGSLLACQFHPELSGDWGVSLLRRWLNQPIRN